MGLEERDQFLFGMMVAVTDALNGIAASNPDLMLQMEEELMRGRERLKAVVEKGEDATPRTLEAFSMPAI